MTIFLKHVEFIVFMLEIDCNLMPFTHNMYEYKKKNCDMEKLSKKCVHLKYDINIIYIYI